MELAWIVACVFIGLPAAWLLAGAVLWLAEWVGGLAATGIVVALVAAGVTALAVLG